MLANKKQELPIILSKISFKLESYVFKKLVLYDSQPDDSKKVRHYDLECEGITVLQSFFAKKFQFFKIKAFQDLKERPMLPKLTQRITDRKNITGRTQLVSRINTSSQDQQHYEKRNIRIRTDLFDDTCPEEVTSHFGDLSLATLLNRVRRVNQKQKVNSVYCPKKSDIRFENKSAYLTVKKERSFQNIYPETGRHLHMKTEVSNYESKRGLYPGYNATNAFKSQNLSTRNLRRNEIMSKFHRIEDDLNYLQIKMHSENDSIYASKCRDFVGADYIYNRSKQSQAF